MTSTIMENIFDWIKPSFRTVTPITLETSGTSGHTGIHVTSSLFDTITCSFTESGWNDSNICSRRVIILIGLSERCHLRAAGDRRCISWQKTTRMSTMSPCCLFQCPNLHRDNKLAQQQHLECETRDKTCPTLPLLVISLENSNISNH